MKPSKIALLSLVGIVVAGIVAAVLAARITLFGGGPVRVQTDAEAGEVTSVSRELSGFSEIEIEGNWDVTITQGDGWQVELSAADNDLDAMEVVVGGERLSLASADPRSFFGGPTGRFSADIVMPALAELDAAGASQVRLTGFNGERLTIDVAGATRIIGNDGRYDELDLSLAGAGDVALEGFVFTDADVNLAGASSLRLTMDGGELTGAVAGASAIRYFGTVSRQAVDVAGFSIVEPAEL